ncbi:TetR/AcrR family transcriptional regulator [Actinomadura rubrisoli]|uniref:TetR/AcrR family transcriptional regulator n=1 Tax=Actinomadura rubrisoli TaxID=2530368 RepID=A0A4R5B4G7_9ACTN|nr:TetR/AcrR family transcriptional regulator [Actinomadura rubrisoli]TDD80711.1 TetR/AcrR family transcriptional regulator [Actinomadura rubrisoli]
MGSRPQTRRKDTRQRIQDVALELFLERGYDQTSLREIAERLDVTKAALYYHFRTKEDIVSGLLADLGRPIDELIAWGRDQPRTLETRRELLRRLNESLETGAPFFRFLQENQAALRGRESSEGFRDRMRDLAGLLAEPGTSVLDQVRSVSALFTVYFGTFALDSMAGGREEKRAALLQVAWEQLDAAQAERDAANTQSDTTRAGCEAANTEGGAAQAGRDAAPKP